MHEKVPCYLLIIIEFVKLKNVCRYVLVAVDGGLVLYREFVKPGNVTWNI